MEFYIKQLSTLPILKVKISKDGRSDFGNFLQTLSSSTIYYTMVDVDTGIPTIINRYLDYVVNDSPNGVSPTEAYLQIQFSNKDTKKPGKYKIQFYIQDSSGTIAIPITEDIFIFITESFITDGLTYNSNYVINNPCCLTKQNLLANFLITQNGNKIITQDGYFIIVIL